MPDKYKATWISHSSLSDFLTCPRLYYYRNVYKDPRTGNKITLIEPPLALGGLIHNIVESLSFVPSEQRLNVPILKQFEQKWGEISGKKGGFRNKTLEDEYFDRGKKMLQRILDNPEPLLKKAIKIPEELPHYWLSEEDEIILCGKVDWLQYQEKDDSVHIVDFKTSKKEESENSLQLPIYHLLVTNTQKRKVSGASYWYLDFDNKPKQMPLPDLKEARERVYTEAKRVKLARQIERFKCPKGEYCRFCYPLEQIAKGKGELVGQSQYGQDIYILDTKENFNTSSADTLSAEKELGQTPF